MQQRDIIKDEIEQLGRVLGKIIAHFLHLKAQGNIAIAIQATNAQLQSELDIDIEEIIAFTPEELERYADTKRLTDKHLDELAKYLYELGEIEKEKNPMNASKYFEAAKRLIITAGKISKTFTFERAELKQKIEDKLASVGSRPDV